MAAKHSAPTDPPPRRDQPTSGVEAALAADLQSAEAAATGWLRNRPKLAALAAAVAGVVVKQSYYRLSLSAAGAAFWLVIAIFPAAFAAIMIFGLVVSQDQITGWLDRASQSSPDGLASVVAEQAQQVVQTEPSTLSVGLAVSLALTLWSASAGAYALLRSLRLAYGLAPQSYLSARARGVLATLAGVIGIGLLAGTAVYARRWLTGLTGVVEVVFLGIAVAFALGVIMLAVAATFRFAIAMPTPARCLVPGAALTTVAIALLVLAAALFGSYANRYQATYGALTSVVVTLFALYALMYATLLAALFNAELSPLPTDEVQRAGTPDQQWQKLSSELADPASQTPSSSAAPDAGGLSSNSPATEGQPAQTPS